MCRVILGNKKSCFFVVLSTQNVYTRRKRCGREAHVLASALIEINNKSENATKNDLIVSLQVTEVASFDPERVLKRISSEDIANDTDGTVNNVLVNYLQHQRFSATSSRRKKNGFCSTRQCGSTINEANSNDDPLEGANVDVGTEIEYVLQQEEDNEAVAGMYGLFKVYGGSMKKV
nr:unnamed protein product [Callosobruchus analis]